MARLTFLSVFVIFCVSDSFLQQIIQNVIVKHNETSSTAPSSSKARTLYDYQTHVVAYKDLTDTKCLLEILSGGESRISKWISNGSKGNISTYFLLANQVLTKRQIWRLAGHRITEFCLGFPTYLIEDVANENMDETYMNIVVPNDISKVRRKRSSSHYFQGRVRGQTQSQYLNFGKTDQPGKAEAESTFEGTKAVVSGSNGMGQAQSQSLPFGCEECYGQGIDRYDQGQTLQFAPQRPGEKYPQSIIQERPGGTHINGARPGQFDRGPGQIGGGPGQFGEGPGQIGGGPGQIGGGPEQIGGGPGQIGGGPGQIGAGPGQIGGGPGQIGGGPGQIGAGPGQIGGPGPIGGAPGQFVGGPGQIGGTPGHNGRGPGQIGGGPGQIGGGPGQIVGGPGQIDRWPGQIDRGNQQIGGEPGHIGGGPGQIGGGPGQIGGGPGQIGGGPGQIGGGPGQIGGGPGQIGGGPGQIGGGPGQIGGGPSQIGGGPSQIGGGPSQIGGGPSQIGGGPGQIGVGPGQTGWGPGQSGLAPWQTGGRPGQIGPGEYGRGPGQIGGGHLGGGPGQVGGGHGQVGGGPGQVGGGPGQVGGGPGHIGGGPGQIVGGPGQIVGGPGQIVGGPGQIVGGPGQIGGGPGQIGWTDQYGRPAPDTTIQHRGPGFVDQGAGQVIDLGESVRRPTQHGGTFGGQLTGDYQNYLGQSGRFSGSFSGQYGANGHRGQQPYTGQTVTGFQPTSVQQNGYSKPGGNGQVSQPVAAYGPGYSSQPGVQGPPSVSAGPIHQPGYDGTSIYQPTHGGQGFGTRTDVPGYTPGATGYDRGLGQYIAHGTPGQYVNGFRGPSGTAGQNGLGNGGQQQGLYGPQYGTNGGIGVTNGHLGPSQFVGSQIPGTTGLIGPSASGATEYPGQPGPGQGPFNYGNGGVGVSGQYGVGPQQGGTGYGNQQGTAVNGQYTPYGPGTTGQYGTGGQYGPGGVPTQYTDIRYPGANGEGTSQQLLEGKQEIGDSDSQVQTSVQQVENGTLAQAEAQGTFGGGTAQSQVSGTYAGSGSFSASAGSDDGKRGAQTQVSGGKDGAQSSAQGRGGLGQSQSQVVLSSDTGDTMSSAQSSGFSHGTHSQVHASEKGGMADAQSNGPGSTSSQAQIGFTPYDENSEDNQSTPFRGGGTAGAQSGSYSGITQAQIQGKFRYGIRYTGAAQAGSGGVSNGRNQTIKPGPFKPVDLSINTLRNETSETNIEEGVHEERVQEERVQEERVQEERVQDESSTKTIKNTNKKTSASAFTPIEAEPETSTDGENKDYTEEDYEGDYEAETEKPSTRSIITQSSDNQRQHIIIDPLEDLDITVHQSRGDFPAEGTVLQPGEIIPGSPGYKIPAGFRGTVKSISNGRNTYAIGKNSQAQSVTLSPGSGRIIYKSPLYAVASNTHSRNGQYSYGSGYTYQPAHQPVQYLLKNGRALPNFVSVTKSETGSRNLYTGKKTPSVYYSQSSSCGIFTNHCVFNGAKKVCFPKLKTNPDGSKVGC